VLPGYADEHVPAALVAGLKLRGMNVETVQDRGRRGADDDELLAEALQRECLWLTTDIDFLALASTKSAAGHEFAPILFWPQQARGVRELIAAILQLAARTSTLLSARECSTCNMPDMEH
jgi:hypothetical protein